MIMVLSTVRRKTHTELGEVYDPKITVLHTHNKLIDEVKVFALHTLNPGELVLFWVSGSYLQCSGLTTGGPTGTVCEIEEQTGFSTCKPSKLASDLSSL